MVQNTGVAASPRSSEIGAWILPADENHPIPAIHIARLAPDQTPVPKLRVGRNRILPGDRH